MKINENQFKSMYTMFKGWWQINEQQRRPEPGPNRPELGTMGEDHLARPNGPCPWALPPHRAGLGHGLSMGPRPHGSHMVFN